MLLIELRLLCNCFALYISNSAQPEVVHYGHSYIMHRFVKHSRCSRTVATVYVNVIYIAGCIFAANSTRTTEFTFFRTANLRVASVNARELFKNCSRCRFFELENAISAFCEQAAFCVEQFKSSSASQCTPPLWRQKRREFV